MKKMTLLLFFTAFLCVIGKPVSAQSEPTEISDSTDTLSGIRESVADFQNNFQNLTVAVEDHRILLKNSTEMFGSLITSLDEVHNSLSEESEVWKQIKETIKEWDDELQSVREKSSRDSRFNRIVTIWEERIDEARGLQKEISNQRAELKALVQHFRNDQEYIEALKKAKDSEELIMEMKKVKDSLSHMNSQLQGILARAESTLDEEMPHY